MPKAAADGASIHYEVSGNPDGPWLVLSNSLGTNLHMWDAQAEAFGRDFHVLRYDTRGHGRSDAPEADYSFEQLGGDVLAVMDAAGARTASFCGLSMGGVTGMWLGIYAADRFDRLVLCNTGAKIGDAETWQERISATRTSGTEPIADAVVDRWFTQRFQSAAPEAVARIRAMILETPGRGYAGCCAALRDCDLRAAITAIRLPTLIVAGTQDPATPVALSRDMEAAISGSTVVELDAAHLSNIEQESAFNSAVSAFLKGQAHG